MQNKYLLKDAHIVLDIKRELLNGSLLISNGKIIDIIYDLAKYQKDLSEYKIIDLNNKIIMPTFFNPYLKSIDDDNAFNKAYKYGIKDYFKALTYPELSRQSDNSSSIRLIEENAVVVDKLDELLKLYPNIKAINLNPKFLKEDFVFEEKGKLKILLSYASDDIDKINYKYHGFCDVFKYSSFNPYHNTLANLAFSSNDKYMEIDFNMPFDNLCFLLNHYPKDKLILFSPLISKTNNYYLLLAKLYAKRLFNLTELAAFLTFNAYDLYYPNRNLGRIIKGQKANIIVFDEKIKPLFKIIEGEIYA